MTMQLECFPREERFRAKRDGYCSIDAPTAVMFSGVLTVLGRSAGFLGIVDALKFSTSFKIVFRSRTLSFGDKSKIVRNAS